MIDTYCEDLVRAQYELGDPERLFRVGRERLLAKLAVAVALILYGIAANAWWFAQGNFGFGVFEKFLLFTPPVFGVVLLVHMYRNRGLYVLIYPSGLLRLRRGEVDSFPWGEIEAVKVNARKKAEVRVERDPAGRPTACWVDAALPLVKVWEAGVTVVRDDGVQAHLSPALSDFAQLSEEVQRRTFARLWPAAWDRLRSGGSVDFDDLEVEAGGLRHDTRYLPWAKVREVLVDAAGRLTVKQEGRWAVWLWKDAGAVPNLHVLLALVDEARRHPPLPTGRQPQPAGADHS
jgi:hypothetical protein